jgi:hypothetical protein
MTIYVSLLDEGTPSFYPVEAVSLGNNVYEIVSDNPEPEDLPWEFVTNSKVRCDLRQLQDGEFLVAYELAN